ATLDSSNPAARTTLQWVVTNNPGSCPGNGVLDGSAITHDALERQSRNQIQCSVLSARSVPSAQCTTIRRSFVFPTRFPGPHTAMMFSLVNNLCGLRVLCVRPLRAGVERQSQPNTLLCLTLRAQRTQRGRAATKREPL